MPYSVYLKKNEEKRIIGGHPWVYANEVLKTEGKGKNGDLATVYDYGGRFIGKGYINFLSKILVRIFIRNDEIPDKDFYRRKIDEADAYRKDLGYENCYRVVFSESDDLPGLIVDKYADCLCVQFLSLGTDLIKDLIVEVLKEKFSPRLIYERSDVAVREKEGLKPVKGVLYGEGKTKALIEENGIKCLVDLENGQKTGYFLDQKENRFALRKYAKGKTVLDCFCNIGGFSLNCAIAGAKSVKSLDISEKALNEVEYNAELNGLGDIISTEKADVFEKLREYKKEGKKFDLVILDPPAFCKNASEVKDAFRGYKDINILGMKLVESGGYMVSCSCSHYMTFNLFEKMLKESAVESGRKVRVAEVKTQSPDHASLISEEESVYLKFYILQIT